MQDFSDQYTSNKLAYIRIAFGNKLLQFKPFIDSFSFKMDRSEPEGTGDIYSRTETVGNFKSSRYNLSFSVLANDVEEAKKNHKRFQVLARMVCPDELNFGMNRYLFVQFTNLISSNGAAGTNYPTVAKMIKNGFECIIRKVSYKPIMDLGFFESEGYVFAKGYSLSLELINRPMTNAYEQPIKQSGYSYGRTRGVIMTNPPSETDVNASDTTTGNLGESVPAEESNTLGETVLTPEDLIPSNESLPEESMDDPAEPEIATVVTPTPPETVNTRTGELKTDYD